MATPLYTWCEFFAVSARVAIPNILLAFAPQAARAGNLSAMTTLIDHGATREPANNKGRRPIDEAMRSRSSDAASFLIRKGANVSGYLQSGELTEEDVVQLKGGLPVLDVGYKRTTSRSKFHPGHGSSSHSHAEMQKARGELSHTSKRSSDALTLASCAAFRRDPGGATA